MERTNCFVRSRRFVLERLPFRARSGKKVNIRQLKVAGELERRAVLVSPSICISLIKQALCQKSPPENTGTFFRAHDPGVIIGHLMHQNEASCLLSDLCRLRLICEQTLVTALPLA
ncbi:MAG: hypothetical protein D6719_12120 [Candidatus Dadabacteria bacterium]|nr:MAG: hypothetical protein D6719_12120 [Candidatus Dadabacteria bacterium]